MGCGISATLNANKEIIIPGLMHNNIYSPITLVLKDIVNLIRQIAGYNSIFSKPSFFLIIIFLFGVNLLIFAQRLPNIESLTVDDGLCFRHVNSITQDKNGLMWFGTTNGLSRYDGYRFVSFGKETETDKYFPALEFAPDGALFLNDSILWTIADFQLWAMNIRNFKTKKVNGIEGRALKMEAGKNKDIWLVSDNDKEQLLWRFTEQKGFEKISSVPHFRLDRSTIQIDTSGGVWWSTTTKGLQQFSPGGKWISEAKIDSFIWFGATLYHNEFFIDSRNRFFVFSGGNPDDHQIWRYFPESDKKVVLLGGMKEFTFTAAEDSWGNIWLTKEGGIIQLKPDGFINDYTESAHQTLDFKNIFSIFEDRTNTVWIGTDGGLLKLPVRKQLFDTYFSMKNIGWGNAMRGICEGPDEDIYFFCESGNTGLYRMDKKGGHTDKLRFGMNETEIQNTFQLTKYMVFDQKRNCFWTMTYRLLKINLTTQRVEPQPAISFGREYSTFNPLLLMPDGRLLVGNTLDKLCLYDPESGLVKNLFENNFREYFRIYPKVLLAHGNDQFWVGTHDKGLYLFNLNGDLLKHYHTASQPALINNHVICLLPDENHQVMWAGTLGGGLCRIDLATGEVRVFNRQSGLPDNNVASILGDGDNLWIGTYNGLSCFNKKEESFRNFFAEDGLTHNEFNYSSAFSTGARMYFGGLNGINAFNPKDLLLQELNPPLRLTRIIKYDQRLDSLIDATLNDYPGQVIEISPDISFFTIEWTLPNYFNPNKNQYFTRMEGLETGWTFLGNTPSIRFNKLPPGKYTLHLKGKDSRGNWSESPIELKIHIISPLWKRWWAICLYFIAAFAVFALIRKREMSRLHLQNELEKEHVEAQKNWELDQAKSRFFSNLSHEFRKPLTVILGMSEEIKEPNTAKHLIQRSGRNLLRLVNQMLDFSKLEAGKLTMRLQSGDLVTYLHYLVESFQSLASHKSVQLVFEPAQDQLEMDFDEEKIQHIVSNLLSNAIKFTPSGGLVTLSLSIAEQMVCIKVSDSGIGIPAEALPHIYERYFQVADPMSKGEPGSGIGLAFTKELVELMDGKIEVESAVGVGTVFRVLLPITLKADSVVTDSVLQGSQPADKMVEAIELPNQSIQSNTRNSLLIIEDNPEVVAYIRTFLENNYEIIVAENGEIGIQKAIEQIPDIIISDVMMPVMDGFAVTEFLKNDERTSHIPIVLLTAKADAESRLIGLTRGADAYLAKPFDKKELLVRLEQLIALRKKLQARYAQFAPPQPTEDAGLRIEDAFLQKINGIIEAHLDQAEFGVNELCRAVGLSRPQLFRKLKALTDKSIVAYLRSSRLYKAREFLQSGERNISEVAFEVGFNDPLYFSRAFSQEFGFPPTALLK